MDIVTGQRTFCLGLSGVSVAHATEYFDVPFVDSEGNNIKCSYLQAFVQFEDADTEGIFAFEFSGLAQGDAIGNTLSSVTNIATPNASGVLGFNLVAGAVGTSYTWHGSNGQVVSGVRILPHVDNVDNYFVTLTYGNLLPLNTLRLEQSYDAGA